MTEYLEFSEGALSENIPWRIQFNSRVFVEYSNICRHCHSEHLASVLPNSKQQVAMICPRVVAAFNEAGFSGTEVCLDCILDAASGMEARQGQDAQRLDGEAATARPDAQNISEGD